MAEHRITISQRVTARMRPKRNTVIYEIEQKEFRIRLEIAGTVKLFMPDGTTRDWRGLEDGSQIELSVTQYGVTAFLPGDKQ